VKINKYKWRIYELSIWRQMGMRRGRVEVKTWGNSQVVSSHSKRGQPQYWKAKLMLPKTDTWWVWHGISSNLFKEMLLNIKIRLSEII
jgi:hypothetical protein